MGPVGQTKVASAGEHSISEVEMLSRSLMVLRNGSGAIVSGIAATEFPVGSVCSPQKGQEQALSLLLSDGGLR